MKHSNTYLLICFFFLSLSGFAQKNWDKLIRENPRTTLQEAEHMYKQALKENNIPALLQSYILQIRCKTLIDPTLYPQLLVEIENKITQTNDTGEKSILHSWLAQLYEEYYLQHANKINQRTPLEGYIPDDLNEWSGNLFIEKSFQHALSALKDQKQLQQIPIRDYQLILTSGENSPVLRPTLFDFLSHRSICQLRMLYPFHIEKYFKQQPTDTITALSPLHLFLQDTIPVYPLDVKSHILKIYQDLLLFRNADSTNPSALLMADLERLNYAEEITGMDSVYQSRLRQLRQEFPDNPYVVEVIYAEANYYLSLAAKKPAYAEPKAKALQLARSALKKYPAYERIGLIKNLIQEIETPKLMITLNDLVYPGEKLVLQTRYSNIDGMNVSLYKVNETTIEYKRKVKDSLAYHKSLILQKSVTFPRSLAELDSTLSFVIPESGLYEVTVNCKKNKPITKTFICNSLYTAIQSYGNHCYFMVREALSGKPVKDARINIFTSTGEEANQKTTILTTNTLGLAYFKYPHSLRRFTYEVTDSRNPNSLLYSQYKYAYKSSDKENFTALFTDRKIYQPGQIVYYNGISWQTNTDSSWVTTGKKFTVAFYDANSRKIKEEQVTANSWGTFSGSFVIPHETLNGQFSIQTENGWTQITVAEYKRPGLEIIVNKTNRPAQFGDTLLINGTVKNYAGIALPYTDITYQISLKGPERWQTSSEIIAKGETRTDTNGNFNIHFKSLNPLTRASHFSWGSYYDVSIQATDSKGETQETSTLIPATVPTYLTEIDIPEKINKNLPLVIQLRTLNPNNEQTAETIGYRISKLAPLRDLSETYNLDSLTIEKHILTGQFNTASDSLVLRLQHQEVGAYLFQMTSPDGKTDMKAGKRIFYLYSPSDKHPPILTYNWLIPQKTTCRPGENAEILFGTSAKDVYVLYEIYTSKGLKEQKLLKFSDEIRTLTVPYKEEYGNSISLSLSYVKDMQFFHNEILIHRQRKSQLLNFTTQVFRNKLIPGQEEEWTFSLTDAQGQAVTGEVMAVMYDRALDRLIPNQWDFPPRPYLIPAFPIWREYQGLREEYIWFNFYNRFSKVPPFRFDQLNTYGPGYPLSPTAGNSYGKMHTRLASKNIRVTAAEMELQDAEAVPATSLQAIDLRTNFAETAFFYPQMVTNEKGELILKFTVPETITGWKFMALAHTRDLDYGYIQKEISTIKYLSLQPNLPRFFRSGDSTVIKANLLNQSPSTQEGIAQLELFNALTGQTLLVRKTNFKVSANQDTAFSFGFYVPQNLTVVGCRITAQTATFSDGEQHLIAVAPDKIALTKALPIFSSEKGEHSYTLTDDSKTQQDYLLTLEMTANPIWYAVLALPGLQSPQTENIIHIAAAYYVNAMAGSIAQSNPRIAKAIANWNMESPGTLLSQLEKNSELKSVLLQVSPWSNEAQSETEQMQSLQQLFDHNRLAYLQEKLLLHICQQQNNNGGWAWFKGMTASRFITSNVLTILSRTGMLGQYESGEKEKMAQIKALNYLDKEIKKDYSNRKEEQQITYHQILYLYVRSLYRDIPLGDALHAHKYYMSLAELQWPGFTSYEKALTASAFQRYGKPDLARQILHSLKEYAIISPGKGMFWQSNTSNRTFINSALITHVAIMEAFFETEGNTPDLDLMKQWLLRQKQTQNWGDVPSTVNAIYALLLTGNPLLDQQEQLTVSVGNHKLQNTNTDHVLGYLKASFPASRITPEMKTVVLTKTTNTPSWGALYLQYYEELKQIRKTRNNMLDIEKKLFVEKNTDTGKELHPISYPLHPGNKVVIRLTLKANQDFQYVHLKDLRAGCFEPVEQLSGPHWKYGLSYYQETKEASTNIFFNYLPKGTYVFEYAVWVNQSGIYQDGVATLQSIYAPEFISHSETRKIEVK